MTTALNIGDRVRVPVGVTRRDGLVTDISNPVGVGGRRLVSVALPQEPADPLAWVVGEEEVERIDPHAEPAQVDAAEAEDYLARGGLISILHANMDDPTSRVRAWLRKNEVGGVSYTSEEAFGAVGGNVVPFRAAANCRVFAPKRAEVIRFVRSFGFDRATAERIVAAVGVAP